MGIQVGEEEKGDTEKSWLEVVEELRRTLGKTRYDDWLPNNSTRETCNVTGISSWIVERRTIWTEHVSRMVNTRLVKQARDSHRNHLKTTA